MDLNDELKSLLLDEFFKNGGKQKPKGLLKISLTRNSLGVNAIVEIKNGFRDLLTPDNKNKIDESLQPFFVALGEILGDNEEIKEWAYEDIPDNGHDCENCPEDIKKECQEKKKSIKEEINQAINEMIKTANKSKGVN